VGCVVQIGEVRKPEGERPLRRPKHRWEDNIKMDLRVIGFGHVDRIFLVHDRFQWQTPVNVTVCLRIP
jgi:hypothetical protein